MSAWRGPADAAVGGVLLLAALPVTAFVLGAWVTSRTEANPPPHFAEAVDQPAGAPSDVERVMLEAQAETSGDPCEKAYAGLKAGMTFLKLDIPDATAEQRASVKGDYLGRCRELPEGLQHCLLKGLRPVRLCAEGKRRATREEALRLRKLERSWSLMNAMGSHGHGFGAPPGHAPALPGPGGPDAPSDDSKAPTGGSEGPPRGEVHL